MKPKKRAAGGGRKLKYGEPVKLVPFKCPESKVKEFRKSVNEILKIYIKTNNRKIVYLSMENKNVFGISKITANNK